MDANFVWNQTNSILLETNLLKGDECRNILFSEPVEILTANTLQETEIILKKIEYYIDQGFYLAGYISYEAGYLFEVYFRRLFESVTFPFPLIWFGVYKKPTIVNNSQKRNLNPPQIFSIPSYSYELSKDIYSDKIKLILEHIEKGETYQVNFTFPIHFTLNGDLPSFYEALKSTQKVSYNAVINDGSRMILSFSPELFFKLKNNEILTRPMKGTISRGKSTLDDQIQISEFRSDIKIKAENSMIVDLIRNDLSKVSEIGSVQVDKLLDIEEYETLFQMTSTINAKLKKNLSYFELFKAIFPGGSITGAPKFKTMQIIKNLEITSRGIYTGAIGFISKEESIFNIAIRTIEIKNNEARMGIGGGIVWDSIPENEYEECILKQRFLQNTIPFRLIESILLKNNNLFLLGLHLKRLEKSAVFFGFPFNKDLILNKLLSTNKKLNPNSRYKIRLELSRFGDIKIENSILSNNKKQLGKIEINSQRVFSKNIFQMHKTTNRELYNTEYQKAIKNNIIDYVFLNEKDEVVETSIYTVFIKQGNQFFTPPLSVGALPSVMREYLINKGKIKEKSLTISDLKLAEKIYLCNSVRGIVRVNL